MIIIWICEKSLLDFIAKEKYTYLPNTAGCYSKDEAIRTLRLARELLDGHNLVKLEVLGDPNTLYPNVIETVEAAKTLIKEGFDVMVYTSDDPIIAKQLEDIGCCAIMPLASLIGSGMGILNPHNLEIIIDNAKVPIIVDAGVGTASDAFAFCILFFPGFDLLVAKGTSRVDPTCSSVCDSFRCLVSATG